MSSIIETLVVKVASDISHYQEGLAQAVTESAIFEQGLNKIGSKGDSFIALGNKAVDFGTTLSAKVTAPIVALGTLSAKAAIDFESSFAGVRKTVDATEEEFAVLETGIRGMTKTLPATANEISAVAEAAGQLGIKKENILSFTRTMIDLGEATNLSSEEAATSFARFANIVGMSQNDFDKLGSTVVALGNNFATTEAEIVQMGMRLAGAGSQVGLTESQIMSFATALSSVGIEAEAGGSSFSKLMVNMSLAVETGSEELQNFANVANMSSAEFQKAFKEDAAGAIIAFLDGLKQIQADGGSVIQVLDDMGIKEVNLRDTILRAAGASDLFTDAVEMGSEAWEKNTALAEEAEQRYATLASRMSMVKNKVTDVAIELGEVLLPYVEKTVSFVSNLTDKFSGLSDKSKDLIVKVAGIAAAIGPAVLIFGKTSLVVGNVIKIFGKLQPKIETIVNIGKAIFNLSSPVGIAVAGVTALIGIILALYNTNEEFRTKIQEIWLGISSFLTEFFEGIKASLENVFNGVKEFWDTWGEDIKETLANIWAFVGEVFIQALDGLVDFVVNIFNSISEFWNTWGDEITEFFTNTWENIKTVFTTVFEILHTIVTTVFDAIKAFWDKWGSEITEFFSITFETLKEVVSTVFESVYLVVSTIFTKIKEFWDKWGKAISLFFSTTFENIKITATKVFNFLKDFWDKWGASITAIFKTVWDIIKIIFDTVLNVIKGLFITFSGIFTGDWSRVWEGIKTIASTIWNAIKGIFSTVLDSILKIAKNIFENIKKAISDKMNEIRDKIDEILDTIKTNFDKLKEKALNWGKNMIQGFIDGIKSKIAAVGEAASNIASTVGEFIGFSSPSKKGEGRNIVSWGKNMVSGFISGIESMKPVLNNSLSNLIPPLETLAPISRVKKFAENFTTSISDGLERNQSKIINRFSDIKTEMFEKAKDNKGIDDFSKDTTDKVNSSLNELLKELIASLNEILKLINSALEKSKTVIDSESKNINTIIDTMTNKVKVRFKELSDNSYSWGYNLMDRFNQGLESKSWSVKSTVESIKDSVSSLSRYGDFGDNHFSSSSLFDNAKQAVSSFSRGVNERFSSSTSNVNISTEGLFKGAKLEIRNDEDINKLSRTVIKMLAEDMKKDGRILGNV